ncbi:hypothetical protein [Eleftheria terrae]|uniref:hypothetical protein n=1 Tax=Eleftheria terrae TaxID=1597781 RepID=UPI00263A45EF|nr:hypothetical protein [Eleftheria terrae]WKB52914.1 hypothetical protein N7L95_00485 [Eleftheria terrae]
MAPLAPSAPRGCGEHGAPGPFEAGRQGRPDGGSSRDTESPLLEQRLIAARRAVAAAEAELAHRMAELELRRVELCDVVRQIETARRCDAGPGSKGGPVAGRLALHTS